MGSYPGLLVSAHLGRCTKSLLAQIVLGSDYSVSVKGLLQPVLRNVSLNRKEEQNDLWIVFL